jgi:hypothetical protein
MPHYKDGTLAKVGDVVAGPLSENQKLVGVVAVVWQSESCNMGVGSGLLVREDDGHRAVLPFGSQATVSCKDFIKVALWLLTFGALCAVGGECSAQQRPSFGPGYYQPPAVNRLDQKVDGHTQYNIGRSAEPPTAEAEKLFFTVVTSDAWQSNDRERQLIGWLNNDPRLGKLRSNCRFNWYVASNPHYRDRLRFKYGEALPIVNISRPDGEAILHVTALSLPRTSGELADMADDAVNAKYAPPPVRSGGPGRTQIVEDCPNCDPPGPPNTDDGQQVDPINEVIPNRGGWLHIVALLAALAGAFVFVLGGALVLAVMFWPRPQPTQLIP